VCPLNEELTLVIVSIESPTCLIC